MLLVSPTARVAAQEPVALATEPAAATKTETMPITLAIPFASGRVYRYKSTVAITGGSIQVQAELTRRETTTEVKANGEIRAELVEEGGKAIINGMENPLPAGKPVRLLLDRYSRLLLFTPTEEGGDFISPPIRHIMALADRIAFPRLPVKPGDTWETEVRNPTGRSRRILIKTTYLGTERVGASELWKMRQTFEVPTEDGSLGAETIGFVDPATGDIVQADQTLTKVPTAAGVVTWKGKIQRL